MFLQSFWKASYINSRADSFYPACAPFSVFCRRPYPPPVIEPAILLLKMFFIALVRTESDRCDCFAHIPAEKPSLFAFSPLQTGSSRTNNTRFPAIYLSLRKSLLSYSFFNFLFSFYDNTPAPMDSTHAMSFQTLSHFFSQPKRNSRNYL